MRPGDRTYVDLAAAVLVAHQRYDAGSCLCGPLPLGSSHAEHQAEVLDAAGALRQRPERPRPGGLADRLGDRARVPDHVAARTYTPLVDPNAEE